MVSVVPESVAIPPLTKAIEAMSTTSPLTNCESTSPPGIELPLIFQNMPIGVLAVYYDKPHEFSPEMVELLRTFANQVTLFTGGSIAGEVWALPTAAIGALLAEIRSPLGLGPVMLQDGPCLGFLAEAQGVATATDITGYGGWRAWLNGTTFSLGMQNVFDSDPPFVAGTFGTNYDQSLATMKGRFWYVQLKKRF